MNYNEEHTDLFDRYLAGTLTAEEQAAFEKRLAEDKDFAEAFNIHGILVSGIRDHGHQELKNYLKEHGKMQWSRPSNMRYAAAAVIAIFIGVYAIIHFYVRPNNAPGISLNSAKEQMIADSLSPMAAEELAMSKAPARDEGLVLQSEKMEEAINAPQEQIMTDISPPPSIAEADGTAGAGTYKDMDMDYAGRKDDNISIAVEKKLKDSTWVVPILYAIVEDSKSIEVESTSVSGRGKQVEAKKTKSAQRLPANVSNNASGGGYNNANTVRDTVQFTNSKPTAEQDKNAFKKSMKVEFWQSPVNFRGYKYTGNTIQLYGLSANAVKLYMLNGAVYLKTDGMVYLLTPCSDGCAYKSETNTEISDFIIKQE